MKVLIIFAIATIIFLAVVYPAIGIIVFRPFRAAYNGIKDLYAYIVGRQWRIGPVGFLNAYVGLFGKGKTLSAVNFCINYYNRYNNRKTLYMGKLVTQYVHIVSNVTLSTIPYVPFTNMHQLIEVSNIVHPETERHIYLFLGDELGVQMNSRNFKSNFDGETLNAMLCCRHYGICMVYTAQRFDFVDKLLRSVTHTVFECNKVWRIESHKKYDAYMLENATNSNDVKPIGRSAFWCSNELYNSYNTLAVVDTLKKSVETGDRLPTSEIIAQMGGNITVENTERKKHRLFA